MSPRSWILLAALAFSVLAVTLAVLTIPGRGRQDDMSGLVQVPPERLPRDHQAELKAVPPPAAPVPAAPAQAPRDPAAAPLPFPANAPEAQTPRGFPRLVEDVVQKCGMPLQVLRVDCAEYPCIAWVRATSPHPAGFGVSGCRAWTDAVSAPSRFTGFERDSSGGNVEQYFAFYAVPGEPELAEAGETRAEARIARVREELDLRGP